MLHMYACTISLFMIQLLDWFWVPNAFFFTLSCLSLTTCTSLYLLFLLTHKFFFQPTLYLGLPHITSLKWALLQSMTSSVLSLGRVQWQVGHSGHNLESCQNHAQCVTKYFKVTMCSATISSSCCILLWIWIIPQSQVVLASSVHAAFLLAQ